MSSNAALTELLERIATLLELLGEDRFKSAAHSRAARAIEAITTDVGELARDRAALLAVEGIGPKIADKIIEYAATGRVAEHDELLARVPVGLLRVLEIPGLGPKTVRSLWQDIGVVDIPTLKAAIDSGAILSVPRMGQKSVDKIKSSLAFLETSGARVPLGVALPLAERLVSLVRAMKGVTRAEFAGSLRRGKETIGDIDILAACDDAASVLDAFVKIDGVREVLARGDTKTSVRMAASSDGGRWGGDGAAGLVQVDVRVLPESSFGAAWQYFTGSKEHNVRLRELAQRRGLTLNEYGLFPDDGQDRPHARGVKPIASATEESIYEALGVPCPPPERREDRGELDAAPDVRLVEVADIRAELHAHTTASDGHMSIVELASEAKRRGFHTIAVTDHSRSSAIAGGLSDERLRDHISAIHASRAAVTGITLLAGSEVDILADGALDYDDDLLAKLDVVVASPHAALSQPSKEATERLLRAISNPMVHILGHPTGRLITRRSGLEPDIDAIIRAAVKHDVALEINAHWMRLDLRDTHVGAAVRAGCLIAIDCDVHGSQDFDNLRYGVLTGRRGGLPAELCINTWNAERLHKWLRSKRPAAPQTRA